MLAKNQLVFPFLSFSMLLTVTWNLVFIKNLTADDTVTLPNIPRLSVDSPVTFSVKNLKPGHYQGQIAGTDRRLSIQVGLGPAGENLAVVIVPAGVELSGKLVDMKLAEPVKKGVSINDDGQQIDVAVDGKAFFTALGQSGNKPIIYPIYGPGGEMMTRNYPMKNVEGEERDHPHQRSMWMTFGKVNNLDFWASDPINGDKAHFGRIVPRQVESAGGPIAGSMVAHKDWTDRDGNLVLRERNTIVVYSLPHQRIMDVSFVLTAPENAPVLFGDTKEGMFGLRVPSILDTKAKKGGKIVNSNGIEDDAAWGKSASWVDYSGVINGKTVGVAVLNHPSSFRYPTHWHVRNYGLFAANPFGLHDFGTGKSGEHKLEAGQSIEFGYRVILHHGRHDDAKIADAFKAFEASKR